MAITVTALSVTPVKGTRIRSVSEVELGPAGARGDRAFYVVDADGALVNGKRAGALQQVLADVELDAGAAPRTLTLRFPDGTVADGVVSLGAAVDTTFHGRERAARELDGPWSAALSAFVGRPLRVVAPVAAGGRDPEPDAASAVDRGLGGAVSLISRGSLRRLSAPDVSALRDGEDSPVDGRRFRMLIEVDGSAHELRAHAEDGWVGTELTIGTARVRMQGHVGRCVVTTRNVDSGDVDLPTLKMLGAYRRFGPATTEPLAFGVHGAVLVGGRVRVGDAVTVLDEAPAPVAEAAKAGEVAEAATTR